MATYCSILAGKFHGQRGLVGYRPWGCKELDTTEHAHTLGCTTQFNQGFYHYITRMPFPPLSTACYSFPSEHSLAEFLTSIFLPIVYSRQFRLFLSCVSKFFKALPNSQATSIFLGICCSGVPLPSNRICIWFPGLP